MSGVDRFNLDNAVVRSIYGCHPERHNTRLKKCSPVNWDLADKSRSVYAQYGFPEIPQYYGLLRTSRYIINNIGVQQVLFLRVIENLSVFQQQNRHYSFGDAYVAHKNTVENASLNTLRTSTVERARVPAIAFHGQNIRYKGLGDDFKRWTDQLTVARPISFRM